MICLLQNDEMYNYDIRSVLQAFFENEKIITSQDETRLVFEIKYDKESVTASVSSNENDKILLNITCNYKNKNSSKNKIKKLVYQVLSQYTGRKLPWGTLTGIRPTKIATGMIEKNFDEEDIVNYYIDSYLTSNNKAVLSVNVAKKELELLDNIDYRNEYSIYIGIPFCPTTCLYCSFTSYPITMYQNLVDDYMEALFKEMTFVAERYQNKNLTTVYIGGGTPTSLSANQLDRLLKKVSELFDLSNLREFTVEAGRPDSITFDKLSVLKNNYVTRISINPQTMNDETLKLIGRRHSVDETINAYGMARKLGFDNINMDIIAGLPGEDITDLSNTLDRIFELKPDSLTVHSLAIKRAARLNLKYSKYEDLIKGSTNDMLELASDYAKRLGLEPYYLYRQKNIPGNLENIGYCSIGKECLYNILIMEEKQDIVALGAGTSSKFIFANEARIERVENVKNVYQYIQRIDEMILRKKNVC